MKSSGFHKQGRRFILRFEDFLMDVYPGYHEFANQTRDFLLSSGCAMKISTAKSGYLVSFADKNKRVIANFVFRKSGLVIRIYGDAVNEYNDFLETLPGAMIKAIEKAPVCKRLIDLTKCNSKCRMGYQFTLNGAFHQKCQYNCFMFPVNDESIPFISDFLRKEIAARM
jgi:hypothetical protein